ncbi:hypothetical protein F5H01DRAFT_322381 [Linnemannia elongata]|nr:hypothetical protein F5H01DRAFT_322381 [Linnemannia elongata]
MEFLLLYVLGIMNTLAWLQLLQKNSLRINCPRYIVVERPELRTAMCTPRGDVEDDLAQQERMDAHCYGGKSCSHQTSEQSTFTPMLIMKSLIPQGSATSQSQATDFCTFDDQARNDKGKRVLSQLERTTKFGRMSSKVGGSSNLQCLCTYTMDTP